MDFKVTLSGVEAIKKSDTRIKREKGKSIIDFPDQFTLIDIETTGLDANFDSIIEIGALKVKNDEIVDSLSTLVKPDDPFDLSDFITDLTGITPEMINNDGIDTESALHELLDFVKDDLIVGYNVSFDINFIYDNVLNLFGAKFNNNYIDIMRSCRKLTPELKHHRVKDILKEFDIGMEQKHRALSDCKQEFEIYKYVKDQVINGVGIEEFIKTHRKNPSKNIKLSEITTSKEEFDENNPFFQSYVAFTGGLDTMIRLDAMQVIKDLGGEPQKNVTKKTNYLLLGNNFYQSQLIDGKSSKYKKALALKSDGQPIEIITENVFLDIIDEME